MKYKSAMPPSGVKIENSLTMALHGRGRSRNRFALLLLAILGTVSVISTFLTMFTPPCHFGIVIAVSVLMVSFFSLHGDARDSTHYTLLLFIVLYAIFFYWKRETLSGGLMYLMNSIYQTIYMTDWEYFVTDPSIEPMSSITMTLCFALVPICWLLAYAVMRFQNFFLCLLVTFPFVEIGFFFGIAPDHLPAAGLASFWCGMGALQLASGSGNRTAASRSGFQRRRAVFFPVSNMRFLLTEQAGLLTAVIVFVICCLAEIGLHAAHYERPDRVKEMRTNFQYYVASIDWSDMSSVFPFLADDKEGEQEETIELGRSDRREFQNSVVSSATFSAIPAGRTYLKFSTYQTYDRSRWKSVDEETRSAPIMDAFQQFNYYPPEFLFYTAQSLGFETADLTLTDPSDTLRRCVPYGFCKQDAVECTGDLISNSDVTSYTIFAGQNYENLLLNTVSYDVPAGSQVYACPSEQQEALTALLDGHGSDFVQFPETIGAEGLYFGGEEGLQLRAEAAVLSAAGYTDLVYERYTQVPDTEEMQTVRKLFADLLEDYNAKDATAAQTMMLLGRVRDRICANVTYSLSPGKTPPGEDYVLYFLTDSQKGYCTHYATAGTLIARMAGIPARYCEGYLIDKNALQSKQQEDGSVVYTTNILDSNAHAWTEIYIEGFGWIPFEFTFSYFDPPELPTETETETMTEMLSEDPTEFPSETQPVTSFVPVQPSTEIVTTEVPVQVSKPQHFGRILALLAVLLSIGIMLMSFVLWRKHDLEKRELLLSDPVGDAAAQYAWSLILERLTKRRVNIRAGSIDALAQDITAKCGDILTEDQIRVLVKVGSKLRYSPHGLTEPEREVVIVLYRKINQSIYDVANPAAKLWLKWICHYL